MMYSFLVPFSFPVDKDHVTFLSYVVRLERDRIEEADLPSLCNFLSQQVSESTEGKIKADPGSIVILNIIPLPVINV